MNSRDDAETNVDAAGDEAQDVDLGSAWDQPRWVRILDRIEHRQPEVGLRFWGPPLWLEVTMVGPDSDLWPTTSEQAKAWDWQSSAPCVEAAGLVDAGAGDDRLLAVVARYTIENLILNAVHEIGEWFRFDGRRLFPPHGPAAEAPSGAADQGNGAVTLRVKFGRRATRSGTVKGSVTDHQQRDLQVVSRLTEAVPPEKFTCLPGTTISYEAAGPVIRTVSDGEPTTSWRSTWSRSTLEAMDGEAPSVVASVGRDVHRALVSHEADVVCRAFHIDGSRPWTLVSPALGADPPDTEAHEAALLSISVDYADIPRAVKRPGHRDHSFSIRELQ